MQAFVARVALVGALLLPIGCGGGSSTDPTAKFKAGFSPVVNQLKQTSHAIGVAIEQAPSKTDAQLGSEFHALAGRWQSQVSQLETLKPPADLSASFNTLTAAATRTEADLTAIVAAAETHSVSAARQASATLVTDILSAKSASTTITKKLGLK